MRSIRGNYAYLFRHHFMFATKHTGFTAVAPGLLRCGRIGKGAHTSSTRLSKPCRRELQTWFLSVTRIVNLIATPTVKLVVNLVATPLAKYSCSTPCSNPCSKSVAKQGKPYSFFKCF